MTTTARPSLVHRRVPTPLGPYLLAADDSALCGVWRAGQAHPPRPEQLGAPAQEHPLLTEAAAQLQAYLRGEREAFALPLRPQGTPFQLAVWEQLRQVPRGTTTGYGALARAIGRARAAQAVGGAVGRNPLQIVVPCHRVLGADGSLTGYAGGLETKIALLRLEGVALPEEGDALA